jgi:hypothetical protein
VALQNLVDRVAGVERSLVLLNRDQPRPIADQLARTFADQPVAVDERSLPDAEEDLVALVEDGEVVATSPLSTVRDAVLLVNSDVYTTGLRELEDADLPAVLAGLAEVPFDLQGYPESNREKLLLVAVSRLIERRAWLRGAGRHRASFQRLSRIDDERGTRRVYDRLAAADLDVHVYGVGNATVDVDATVHAGDAEPYRRSWVVVFQLPEDDQPPADPGPVPAADEPAGPAALLAWETEPRRWHGVWTYRPALVDEREAAVVDAMG